MFFIAIAIAIFGSDNPKEAYEKAQQQERVDQLAKLEALLDDTNKTLKEYKKARVNRGQGEAVQKNKLGITFDSATTKQKKIKETETKLQQLTAALGGLKEQLPRVYLDLEAPKVGAVGVLPSRTFRVEQVIGPNSLLISARVNSVDGNARREWLWIEGIDTTGMVDGTVADNAEPFVIKGTKKYATAGNATRTVFVLELITMADRN